MNFFRTPALLPWLYPSLLWKIKTDRKVIYLTFDDGPVPGPTEFALDTLRSYQARAVFFCIGDNVRKHAVIFKRIIAEGHGVGNHTFNHLKGWSTPLQRYEENISLCENQFNLTDIGWNGLMKGSRHFFRPPYGRMTTAQIRMLANYKIVMWDVLTNDYDQSLQPEKCLRRSIAATRPGSIVVFHDSAKAEERLTYVLPRYLEHFANLGYAFENIPAAAI